MPEGNSQIKVTGMLVVLLRGVNCRFWSHLGCLNGNSLYLPIQVSLRALPKGIYKNLTYSLLRDQFKLEPHPRWSPWGLNFNFLTSVP